MCETKSEDKTIDPDEIESSKFKIRNYCICGNIHKYFKDGMFCDVILKTGKDDKGVPAHRLVLCAANEHFAEHFTKTTPEQQTTEIYFENVAQNILFMMIDFCYTGEIDVTKANVDTILAAAHEFQFFNLKKRCAEYCKTILRPSDCLWIWPLAEKYELKELSELAFQQALLHFLDIWQYESLNYLEIHQIRALLSHDLLNIESEEDVFNAVVEWIEFNLEERKPQIQDVLETVRVGLITNSLFHDRILNWCEKHGDPQLYVNICERKFTELHYPRESTLFGRLLVIGGSHWEAENGCMYIERFFPRLDCWKRIHELPEYRGLFGAVAFDERTLVVIGGSETNRSTWVDLDTFATGEMGSLITERSGMSTAVLEGLIYAIGGHKKNVGGALNSVERYESDKWKEVAPMLDARGLAATAILSGTLYVMGGVDDTKRLDSVEYFIPYSNKWTYAAPMNEKRTGAQAGVANGSLYVFGGLGDEDVTSSSIEMYDPVEDKWTMMTFGMQIPRAFFGMTMFEEWAYLAGGFNNDNDVLSSFEKINIKTGEKVTLPPMDFARSYLHIAHFTPQY